MEQDNPLDNSLIIPAANEMKKFLELKVSEVFSKYDLRFIELQILIYLKYHQSEGNTASDLINYFKVSKAHVSKSIDNLQQKGYVTLKTDEKDKRVIRILLTETAEEPLEEAIQKFRELKDSLLHGVSKKDLSTMHAVLNKMIVNIQKLQKEK